MNCRVNIAAVVSGDNGISYCQEVSTAGRKHRHSASVNTGWGLKQIKEIAEQYSEIIVLEEHQKSCGIGSAIIEQISDLYAYGVLPIYPRIKRIAIDDKFYSISGSQDYLREKAGLRLF